MRAQDYVQASTFVRVREKSFLTREQWERLIESASLDDALRVLQESSYGALFQKLDDPRDFERVLSERLKEEYEEMMRFVKDPELLDILRLRYDAHNEKVLLKERILDEPLDELIMPLGTFDVTAARAALRSTEGVSQLPEHMKKALEAYEEEKDPQALAHASDHHYLAALGKIAEKLDSDLLKSYASLSVDYYNVMTLLRAQGREMELAALDELLVEGGRVPLETLKAQYFSSVTSVLDATRFTLPDELARGLREAYEAEPRLSALERAFDIHLLKTMQEGAHITFGPEVLFNFMIQLENEVRNLRVILVSKISQIEPARIRERIRRYA